jgi:hypothetical protein
MDKSIELFSRGIFIEQVEILCIRIDSSLRSPVSLLVQQPIHGVATVPVTVAVVVIADDDTDKILSNVSHKRLSNSEISHNSHCSEPVYKHCSILSRRNPF